MTACGSCTAPTEMYLCSRCCDELKELLGSLLPSQAGGKTDAGEVPVRWRNGLLDYLSSAAAGQARLGDGTRRVRSGPTRLDGDDPTDALYLKESGKLAGGGRFEIWQPKYTLNRLLATGRVNARASDLRVECFEAMRMWALHIAKTHQLEITWRTTMGYADFLHKHIHQVALDEDAGELLSRVRGLVRRIERTINRPEQPQECGLCPTIIDRGRKGRSQCGTRLTAPRRAIQLECPTCHITYNIERLKERLIDGSDEWVLTRSQIMQILPILSDMAGIDQGLPARTFDNWRADRRITQLGWWRPGDPIGVWHELQQTDGDRPTYRLADVRRLMAERPRRKAKTA